MIATDLINRWASAWSEFMWARLVDSAGGLRAWQRSRCPFPKPCSPVLIPPRPTPRHRAVPL